MSDIKCVNNGDGISFFDDKGIYMGFRVNKVIHGKLIPSQHINIPKHARLFRTYDQQWENEMMRPTATRKIAVDITIDEKGVSAIDERGNSVRIAYDAVKDVAQKPFNPQPAFEKLGSTIYYLRNFDNHLNPQTFIPMSQLTPIRRELLNRLDIANLISYKYEYRKEEKDVDFPSKHLDYQDNVSNKLAVEFYKHHGVKTIEPALEIDKSRDLLSLTVMTCRHCILREIGNCKHTNGQQYKEPLTIISGNQTFELKFNCQHCEMQLLIK